MSVPALKDLLVPDFLPEDDWKRFWDAARRDLKADPLVEIPARRNDPIRILDKVRDFGSDWIARLEAERDPESILRLIGELARETDVSALGSDISAALAARLAFVVLAARGNRPDIVARCVLTARRLGVARAQDVAEDDARIDVARLTESLLAPADFLAAGARLPARDLHAFVEHVTSCAPDRAAALMLDVLPRMTMGLLSECMDWLVAAGRQGAVAEKIVALLRSREASGQIVWWVCRQLGLVDAWDEIHLPEVLAAAVDFLASSQGADELRAQNQLRAMFEDAAWIGEVMEALDPAERRNLLTRVSHARTWDIGSRRSVMARMIKADPMLQETVSDKKEETPAAGVAKRITSWRSYLARQNQLKELVEVTIPANSRDIGIARSYGDLRENFEYQAARDQQKLLLRRQADLERDLQEVRGTDFESFTADRVGPGTIVRIERPGGAVERICVLGEWDRDEALGVISSESRLAKLLAGARPGDMVAVPANAADPSAADENCRVIEVTGLSDELKDWAAGR
jgi:transcription elongation GreA/GreB family factor